MFLLDEKVTDLSGSWERLKASRAFKAADAESDFAALCVVGTDIIQPRRFGDNMGAYPTRLVVTIGKPELAGSIYNRGVFSETGDFFTQTYVWWPSRKHAEDARDWLEEQIRREPLRNGWSNLEWWEWAAMFKDVSAAIGVECFDENEKNRRVWARAKRGT